MRLIAVLLLSLGVAACYEVREPTLAEGVRVEGLPDGVWRRSDGSEVALAWDGDAKGYRVSLGGTVRLAPVGKLWLADYRAERSIVMLARVGAEQVVFLAPSDEAERRLAGGHGLALKPGPIKRLTGEAGERRQYLEDLAALAGTPDLVEVERLTRVR